MDQGQPFEKTSRTMSGNNLQATKMKRMPLIVRHDSAGISLVSLNPAPVLPVARGQTKGRREGCVNFRWVFCEIRTAGVAFGGEPISALLVRGGHD